MKSQFQINFPPFRPRRPWWGADLQTIRNNIAIFDERLRERGERLWLPLQDGSGDHLAAALHRPSAATHQPLTVLIHGLGGCEDSDYIRTHTDFLVRHGFPVLRLNLRGSGPSRPRCRLHYHAGLTADLRDALQAIPQDLKQAGLLLVGYSLGGNLVLKFLSEYANVFPVLAAATVSSPIDLARASERMLQRRNRLYNRHMVRVIKRDALGPGAEVSFDEARAIRMSRSIYEFDDRFQAPRNGFRSADDYYEKNSSLHRLADVPVPSLLVTAADDPWIPAAMYNEVDWSANPKLNFLIAAGGGHVGFHAADDPVPWHCRCIQLFFRHVLGIDSREQEEGHGNGTLTVG